MSSNFIIEINLFSSKFKCSHEGRYADTADCGSYYTCTSAGARGGLEVAHGSCNGFAFHPQERACVSIDRVSLAFHYLTLCGILLSEIRFNSMIGKLNIKN